MNYEMWKPIDGYCDFYEVSNFGNVKSKGRDTSFSVRGKARFFYKEEKVLSKYLNKKTGYFTIKLYKQDGSKKTFCVHQLVAKAFLPKPWTKLKIIHKNGVKTDNRIENLEWVTNLKHSIKTKEICKKSWQGKFGIEHKASKKVLQIAPHGKLIIKHWDSAADAARDCGFKSPGITRACKTGWLHHGFYWKFAEN